MDSVQKGVKSSEAKSGSAQQQLIYSILTLAFAAMAIASAKEKQWCLF